MSIDHSLTYRKFTFKNLPHRVRFSKILSILDQLHKEYNFDESYLDIGCSNGYITDIIKNRYKFQHATGMDHNTENLALAKQKYPSVTFEFIDLNIPPENRSNKFDLVTCFETLEHVGDLKTALHNILNYVDSKGLVVITVPIEINLIGLLKFLAKVYLYRYSLEELPGQPSKSEYLKALIKGSSISKFRDSRGGWGTHFGFDYRSVDEILQSKKINFKAKNFLTTRLYVVPPKEKVY